MKYRPNILLRFLAFAAVTFVTLYALAGGVVTWHGSSRWAEMKSVLEKEGAPADFLKTVPPAIAAAENYCAIEPLNGITLEGGDETPQGQKRAALAALGWPFPSKVKAPELGGRVLGCGTDLAAWAAFARETGFIPMPADSGQPARDLLAALDVAQPLLKRLTEAASTHPRAMFVPTFAERPLPAALAMMALPHYSSVMNAGRGLSLRSLAACASGDSTGAVAGAQAMCRLTDALLREPVLIATLVAVNTHETAQECVWAILEKRQASEAELQALQAALEAFRFDEGLLLAARGELAMGYDSCDLFQRSPGEALNLMQAVPMGGQPPPVSPLLSATLGLLVPAGLTDLNKTTMARLGLEGILRPLKTGSYASLAAQQEKVEQELVAHRGWTHPGYFMSCLIMPAWQAVTDRVFAAEAVRRQAVTACALERWYLRHQACPADLKELVPELLPTLPIDPMDGQPLRYQRSHRGRYKLWSVGFDGKDDGGQVNLSKEGKPAYKVTRRNYVGDWTWQYEPVK